MVKRKVIWPLIPRQQLRNAYNYVKNDSLQNAEKIRKSIIASTKSLSNHPLKHPLDKLRIDNDGTFRAYELLHYRISYRVTDTEIIVVRVRHASMEPSEY